MLLPLLAMGIGLVVLVWSSDRFVTGAALAARLSGVSPLLIGIVIIGFGTSMPELIVSAIAALQGAPELALGNAYGSNIANIALILGLAAIIKPIRVHSQVLRKEIPLLGAVTLLSLAVIWNRQISRLDAWILLGIFAAAMTWTARQSIKRPDDELIKEVEEELPPIVNASMKRAVIDIVIGLLLLILGSRGLVWGAVEIARALGVSDLLIGLTIVAVGTSLPELASTLAAVRKGEDDLAVGNIVGSNFFNTLAVVGLAGAIRPLRIDPAIYTRDFPVMGGLTLLLFLFSIGRKGKGRINRVEGAVFLLSYIAYTVYLVLGSRAAAG
jgi:cation:H+ antiporter